MNINTWYSETNCKPAAAYIIVALILLAISVVIFIWTYGVNENTLMVLCSALIMNIICLFILYLILTGLCTINETAAWVVAVGLIILIVCAMFAQGTVLTSNPNDLIRLPGYQY